MAKETNTARRDAGLFDDRIMGRLKAVKPRLGAAAPRLGHAPGSERDRDRQRVQLQPWRAWYNTARWRRLREKILKRDRFTCQQTGVMLTAKAPAPNSPVVDHIVPHRGDETLFWNEDNLQTVSKSYHDSEKQKAERAQSQG